MPPRAKIGWTAVALGAVWVVLFFLRGTSLESQGFEAALLRVDLVMVAWWLAYDQLQQLPKWLVFCVPLVIILGAASKRLLPAAVILCVLLVLSRISPRRFFS